MRVAFIGAHPDDEMFCLGTLLLYRNRGDQLSLICATNGDKGMSDKSMGKGMGEGIGSPISNEAYNVIAALHEKRMHRRVDPVDLAPELGERRFLSHARPVLISNRGTPPPLHH